MASDISVQHQYTVWNEQRKTFERLTRTSRFLPDELKEEIITHLTQKQNEVDAALEAFNQGNASEQSVLDTIRDGLLWIAVTGF